MTPSDDHPRDDSGSGASEGPTGPDVPLDEEAAWRAIIENYGERPRLSEPWSAPPDGPVDVALDGHRDAPATGLGDGPVDGPVDGPPPVAPAPRAAEPPVPPSVFDRTYLDALDADPSAGPGATAGDRQDDDHFVPPPPPPLPRPTPARRLAWLGLLVPPVLMFAAVLFRWTPPGWLAFLLVAAFLGGFGFLVATMPRDRDGDDGAVV